MGNKKRKNRHKKKSKIKFESRRDMILSAFPEEVLDIWFGDDEKARRDFGTFILEMDENARYERDMAILTGNDMSTVYDKKIEKIKSKKANNWLDIYVMSDKIQEVNKQIKKSKKLNKLYNTKDLGIARYLDGSRYSKKYMNKDKYRKEWKKIAKTEKKEIKEMRKLGYITSKDPDEELAKLTKANKMMSYALSDAYTQKHFIT